MDPPRRSQRVPEEEFKLEFNREVAWTIIPSNFPGLLDETKQVFLIVPNIPNSSANFIEMTIKVTEAVAQTSFLEAFSIPLLSGVQHPGGYDDDQ